MGAQTRSNLDQAFRGLMNGDESDCNAAICNDEMVDQLELQIDQTGMEILLRFSPVATDLRRVVATIKVANHLERISDHAGTIAKRARKIIKKGENSAELSESVETVLFSSLEFYDTSLDAFRAAKPVDLEELTSRHKKLSKGCKKVVKAIGKQMEGGEEEVKPLLNLIFLLRSVERVLDHSLGVIEVVDFAHPSAD